MKGFFITGTDTEVGKTLVTAGLVGAISKNGLKVGVMKPVQSGGIISEGKLISEDAEILLRASGLDLPMELVNPYCFKPAMSPDLAAGKTDVSIELIKERLNRLAARVDIVFVEGAGGIASPLLKGWTNGDVAYALSLPVIIVSPQRLGVINHTVLT
ncbi:MAG: dethiobiotin synthase, partial [Candidatus Thermoplasmatota archaeon]|nr:dethiobiotin synthase [Candidatus Thermoplasmatota archaeon]